MYQIELLRDRCWLAFITLRAAYIKVFEFHVNEIIATMRAHLNEFLIGTWRVHDGVCHRDVWCAVCCVCVCRSYVQSVCIQFAYLFIHRHELCAKYSWYDNERTHAEASDTETGASKKSTLLCAYVLVFIYLCDVAALPTFELMCFVQADPESESDKLTDLWSFNNSHKYNMHMFFFCGREVYGDMS